MLIVNWPRNTGMSMLGVDDGCRTMTSSDSDIELLIVFVVTHFGVLAQATAGGDLGGTESIAIREKRLPLPGSI